MEIKPHENSARLPGQKKEGAINTALKIVREWVEAKNKEKEEKNKKAKPFLQQSKSRLSRLKKSISGSKSKLRLRKKVAPDQLDKLKPLARLRALADKLKLSPERSKTEKRIYELAKASFEKGQNPGYINGKKDLNSPYYRLVATLEAGKKAPGKGTEKFKKRLTMIKLAVTKYNLPKRFVGQIYATADYESGVGKYLINRHAETATGLGQFLASTWKSFLKSIKGDPYYAEMIKQGHTPQRTNELFMFHAMAWHYNESLNYLMKKKGLSRSDALKKMSGHYTYLTYHEGNVAADLTNRYYQGGFKDQSLIKYSFQREYAGKKSSAKERAQWMVGYAQKVANRANEINAMV